MFTPESHAKEATRLKAAITRAKTKVKASGTLANKLVAKQAVKDAEEQLRLHRLNYHELTASPC